MHIQQEVNSAACIIRDWYMLNKYLRCIFKTLNQTEAMVSTLCRKTNLIKETKSVTINIFRNFFSLFKSFVKVELSYVLQ